MKNSICLCTITFFLLLKPLPSRTEPEPVPDPGTETHNSEEISVPQLPKIKGNGTESIVLPPGKLLTSLECIFQGTPTPKIIWLINGKSLQPPFEEEYLAREGKSVLKFPQHQQIQIVEQRRTNYSCLAANFLGRSMKSFIVTEEEEESAATVVVLPVTPRNRNTNPRIRVK